MVPYGASPYRASSVTTRILCHLGRPAGFDCSSYEHPREFTLKSRRAASSLVRLVEREEKWEASDHLQGVLPQLRQDLLSAVWYSKLRLTTGVYSAFCHYELRRPRSDTVRQLDVLEGLEYSDNPGNYTGGSLTTGRVSHAEQVLVGCSSPVTNRGCNFSPSMNSTPSIANVASVVPQSKKDRVPGLGRGPDSINNLRSPNSLKIIQFNVNGISTSATMIKLDQVLELALTDSNYCSATSNGKLWKLLKNISNEQPQAEQCNAILSEDRNLAVNDEQAADLLGLHYQKISRLNFSVEDRNIKIRASRIVHGCRSDTHRGTSTFSRDFRVNELEAAIGDSSCLNKSPRPDGILGQMIDHLGLS
ncbi:uncharacterized protein TNCV_558921 [Trichonephila clavipes]|nr:uncharacterized protein TNCV_558921 [Trichonephila clavipes]